MVKIGDLKNVVADLQTRNDDLSNQYEQTSKGIANGAAIGQSGVGELQRLRKNEMIHNASKIDRYGEVIQRDGIMHDKARLAEKEAQYKKDYPLASTFAPNITSKVVKKKPTINAMTFTSKIVKK